jgi:hypothetical protein
MFIGQLVYFPLAPYERPATAGRSYGALIYFGLEFYNMARLRAQPL